MVRHQSYVICTSPRSGSTLLCGLLAATGQSGRPDSHFHTPSISGWRREYGLSPDHFTSDRACLSAIFNAARKRGTGDTGLFGLRLQRKSFAFFMQQLDILHPGLSSDPDRFQAAFGKTLFVHLSRRNKLEQAISFVKATQSGLWHRAPDGTELERLLPPREPVYDADAIASQIATLTECDEAWNAWFAAERIAPLRLDYDDLSADPAATLATMLDELGLDRTLAQGICPAVAKLSDATNRNWAKRFAAENRDPEGCSPQPC